MQGLFKPKSFPTLGLDFCGEVVRAGAGTDVPVGTRVFGNSDTFGCFAQYATVGADRVAAKPRGLTDDEAAAIPDAACVALQALRDEGKLSPGARVLIVGASGGIGTFALQIARILGAGHVTGICSTRNVALVKSLGADRVIDYKKDNTWPDERFDVILDCQRDGNKALSYAKKHLVANTGRYVAVAGPVMRLIWVSMAGGKQCSQMLVNPDVEKLETLSRMVEKDGLRPVMDDDFRRTHHAMGKTGLDLVAPALQYVGERRARGKVVISLRPAKDVQAEEDERRSATWSGDSSSSVSDETSSS